MVQEFSNLACMNISPEESSRIMAYSYLAKILESQAGPPRNSCDDWEQYNEEKSRPKICSESIIADAVAGKRSIVTRETTTDEALLCSGESCLLLR